MSRARAGYIFVACLMERMAVDSNIARSYRLPSGRFDAAKCLKVRPHVHMHLTT